MSINFRVTKYSLLVSLLIVLVTLEVCKPSIETRQSLVLQGCTPLNTCFVTLARELFMTAELAMLSVHHSLKRLSNLTCKKKCFQSPQYQVINETPPPKINSTLTHNAYKLLLPIYHLHRPQLTHEEGGIGV